MLSQTQDGAEWITTYNAAMCTINTPPQTVLIGVNTYSSYDHIRILTVCTVRRGRFVFHFIPLLYSCYHSCQPAGFTRLQHHRRFTLPTNSFNSVLWLFSEGKTERTAHCAFTPGPVFVPISSYTTICLCCVLKILWKLNPWPWAYLPSHGCWEDFSNTWTKDWYK